MIRLTKELSQEYYNLFDTCQIRNDKFDLVDSNVERINTNINRYKDVGHEVNIPWYFIAVIHNMESSLNFQKHLHNGDSLNRRTVRVLRGRPAEGSPPFTWEESATDALRFKRLDEWDDWSISGILYQLERYNGWGYRRYHPHVLSPYLWSFSNHYISGKYIADGRWSETAVSRQAGAATLLRRMSELELFDIAPLIVEAIVTESPDHLPIINFSSSKKSTEAQKLQAFLNNFPGVYLREDGIPGSKTSDACNKVFGFYLRGDPRA